MTDIRTCGRMDNAASDKVNINSSKKYHEHFSIRNNEKELKV